MSLPRPSDLSPFRSRIANAALICAGWVFLLYALFPGRFDGDSIAQYRFALRLYFDDALPILNTALLGMLSQVTPGPGPMFVVQVSFYVLGALLITDALIARQRRWAGFGLSVALLAPTLSFDFFEIQKDALLSALLAVLIGIGAQRLLNKAVLGTAGVAAAICTFVLALDARPNAAFALLPLAFLYRPVTEFRLRPVLTTLLIACSAVAVALAGIKVTAYGLLNAYRSHLQYSLIVFDLAGITARTGHDASEGALPRFQAAVARCYTPAQWDHFYLDPACRPVSEAARLSMRDPAAERRLTLQWVEEIATHPAAYLAHRASNFQRLLRLGPYPTGTMSAGSSPRPWNEPGMRLTEPARWWGAAAVWSWGGLAGRGWIWVAVLGGAFAAGGLRLRRGGYEPCAYVAIVTASAGLLYAASFAVFGVADQLRYMHPIIFLAVVAAGFAAGSFVRKSGREGAETVASPERLPS